MIDKLVLVNKKDKVIGFEEKEKCHDNKGILHRAISAYVFNDKCELLIQQRSKLKRLWPLFWSNSCCTHPRKDESYKATAERRIKQELGFICDLEQVDKFIYGANFKNIGSEYEICAVLIGRYSGEIKPNPEEVADWKWINLKDLKKNITKNSDKYTPWFRMRWERVARLI